jgi:hypothetical protein
MASMFGVMRSLSVNPVAGRWALGLLASASVLAGAPRASDSARRLRAEGEAPGSCGEFCAPAQNCANGCGCSSGLHCFICNGCGDVQLVKCFNHACVGFCWKVTC